MDPPNAQTNATSNSSRRRRRKKARPPPCPLVPPDNDAAAPPPRHVDSEEEREQHQVVEEEGKKEEGGEERQTLEWLMAAFSSASLGEVEAVCREARWDAYRAAGILAGRGIERGGRRRKEKVAVAATGMVSDVIGKGYGRPAGGAGKRREVNGEERRRREMEIEEFLFGMMGDGCKLDADVVRDVLGHCGYDLEKAVDKLLDISSSTGSPFKICPSDDYMPRGEKFMDMSQEALAADYNNMEDKLSDKTAESSSGTSENDLNYQYPTSCNCGNGACRICMSEEQSSLSGTNKQELQKKVLLSLFSIPDVSQREPKLMNWKKVVKKLESFGQGLEFSVGPANDTDSHKTNEIAKEDIYQTFRGAAGLHWDTMKSYYQRAAVAYAKGEQAHASYLSEKGRYFNKLAREADEKAGREIFEARNKGIQNEITIDLHGQHVKQAMGLLKLHLLIFTYTPSIQLLRVITGCGSHGIGKGKLKQSVIKLAEREGIQWREENAGTVLLKIDGSKAYSFIETDVDDLE